MHRTFGISCALALAGILVSPAFAEDDAALEKRFEDLKSRVETLKSRKEKMLRVAIERYLDEPEWFKGAQGDGNGWQDATTISARFTAVTQGLASNCPGCNRTFVNGDVDLDFDFRTTENLTIFIHLTANVTEGSENDNDVNPFFPPLPDGSSTMAGFTDGIGINGTVPTDPGSVTVYEAGIHHKFLLVDEWIHWEAGAIDPRTRFAQNAFADDENTQFIDNTFDDPASVLWLTDSTGRTSYGFHLWVTWGDDQMNSVNAYTFNIGWFNTPGQFFNSGQGYVQFHWKGELHGRVFNLRVFGFIDEFFNEGTNSDGTVGGGLSVDWWLTEKLGVFARATAGEGDVNPVEFDAQGGISLHGFFDARPDDVIGVAASILSLQQGSTLAAGIVSSFPEDTEVHVEAYYRFSFEDGRLQITPHILFITDPGGGTSKFIDLTVIGVRVHVPF